MSSGSGWGAVHRRAEEIDRPRTSFFSLKDGQTARIQFMDEEPVCVYQHTLQVPIDGEKRWRSYTCLNGSGESCPFCAIGDTPRFVGMFNIIDHGETDVEKKVKLFTQGIRVLKQLEAKSKKPRGLTGYIYDVTRAGKSTDTTYNFDTHAEQEISADMKARAIDLVAFAKPISATKAKEVLSGTVSSAKDPSDDVGF